MTAPATPDIDVSIEHLDFPATEIACEGYLDDRCARNAEFIVRAHCVACGRAFTSLHCSSCKDWVVRWFTVILPRLVIVCTDLSGVPTILVLDSVTAL